MKEAYEVLSDASKRAMYDADVSTMTMLEDTRRARHLRQPDAREGESSYVASSLRRLTSTRLPILIHHHMRLLLLLP
ncbi:unnamed protein product [Urochloa humidicola]